MRFVVVRRVVVAYRYKIEASDEIAAIKAMEQRAEADSYGWEHDVSIEVFVDENSGGEDVAET